MEPQQWVEPASDPLDREKKTAERTQCRLSGSWRPHLPDDHIAQWPFLTLHHACPVWPKMAVFTSRLETKCISICHLNWYLSFVSPSLSLSIIQFEKAQLSSSPSPLERPKWRRTRVSGQRGNSKVSLNRSSSLSQAFKWLQPWSRHPESEPPAYATRMLNILVAGDNRCLLF